MSSKQQVVLIRKTEPVVSYLVDIYRHNEILLPDVELELTPDDIAGALHALLYSVAPVVWGVDQNDGDFRVVAGGKFLYSVIAYVTGEQKYPEDGPIDYLRGKSFKELPKMAGYRILNQSLNVNRFNKGDEQLFSSLVENAVQLSG
ncbi:hypothetical protein [Vibrio harveyi]|uniref:hypothetical protein n=1 Tax=Vibrio harveyi TaxID=669 RepID=UPI003BB75103|nr:hypothetical protein [Vibrio harveyi]